MEKVAIIGTGLIGTSLGLAMKRGGLKNLEIVGMDLERSNVSKAKKMGAIDKVVNNLPEAVKDASMVIIATPVQTIRDIFEFVSTRLEDGCLVTDTGGTKVEVLEWADQLLPERVDFIGGHPMAGKEAPGPDLADPDMFKGRPYCIVPQRGAGKAAVENIVNLASAIGSRPLFVDAGEHDSFIAAVSHLPFVLSAALIGCTSKSPQWGDINQFASTGYRDVSRLASGDPVMHRDVCVTNRDGIIYWIDELIVELERIKSVMRQDDNSKDLLAVFDDAFAARELWLAGGATPWAQEQSKRSKMPSFANNAASLLIGGRLTERLFGDGNDDKNTKR